LQDKRKLQEEITQKRIKVEEEKMKHQHLKKKALREKWLLDGLSSLTPKEQEEMQKQNWEDQQRIHELEQDIFRLEKEIEALEREEMEVSAKEEAILKKLKSVEKTTEDIIKSVKMEKAEVEKESADYIYTNIPDLPKNFRPSALKSTAQATTDEEEKRKALFAMEIKVEKDMKTGENTVLSTIPVPSKEFKETGIKVYDDGRKSVYAVSSNGSTTENGMDELAPVEVEDLLRQATEKNSQSPTAYHEPVFANKFCRPVTPQKDKLLPGPKLEDTHRREMNGFSNHQTEFSSKTEPSMQQHKENGLDLPKPKSPSPVPSHSEEKVHTNPENRMINNMERKAAHGELKPYQNTRERHNETRFQSPCHLNETCRASQDEEDVQYSIVQAVPCYVDDSEPVTMIFMGYQRVDDDDEEADQKLSRYDGVIRAELVIIDDDDEDDSKSEKPAYHPIGHYSQVYQPPSTKITEVPQMNPVSSLGVGLSKVPHKSSISLREQEERLSSPTHRAHLHSQISGDGTEDPSLTGNR
ncbi:PALMD protein, partial [Thinocorus orbignyianus]|nr:PALMD protein [Thinocorus orbignyianus]